jgi:hypothetical protein
MDGVQKGAAQLAAAASADVVLSAEAEPAAAVAHLQGVQAELGGLQREAERITGLQRTFQVGAQHCCCCCWRPLPGPGACRAVP